MDYRDIVAKVKVNNFDRLYLFYGKEYYLLEDAVGKFRAGLNPDMLDFNLDIIDGKEVQLDQLLSSIETFPFMDERKVVIVKDFEILTGTRKNFSDSDEKYLLERLENIPETTVLVFIVYGDVDKRKSMFKKIKNTGVVCECRKLEDMELFRWVKREFERMNTVIENAAVAYFIEQLGYRDKNSDMTLTDVKNEIIKVASYTGTGNTVTNDITEKLSPRKVENNIFRMIDCIGAKNAPEALKIFGDMIFEGEPVLRIMSLISRQFRIILKVKDMKNEKMKPAEMASKLGVQEFVIRNASRQAENFSDSIILEIMNYMVESEYKIKNGMIGDVVSVEMLISRYCIRK